MPIGIKNAETEHLARELAKRTGVSITEAVTTALREQLASEEGKRIAPRVREERVLSHDVGGSFGMKAAAYPE